MIDSCIRLILDVRQTSMPLTVKAKRSDTGRKLQVTLSDGGAPYTISDDCYAVLTGKKPDSTVLYNRCSVVNNVVEYIFTEQTCAVVGRMPSEIRLYGNDGKLLTSASFVLEVHDTVFHEDDVISQDEMNAWDQLLLETVELKNEVQRKLDNGEFVGKDGADGKDGKDGSHGVDGVTPHVGRNGNWFIGEDDTGVPATGPAGGQGLPGPPGADGKPGSDGADGITPHIGNNGNWYIGETDTGKPSRGADGRDGVDGKNGQDGYTPQKGIDYFDGKDGVDGQPGKDGYTPQKGIDYFDGQPGKDGVDGKNGTNGKTPVRGTDYWTDADQESIVQQVIIALGTPVFGRVDAENNIILTGELADGTYTIKYEDAEGNVTEIGKLNHTVVPEPTYTNVLPLAINADGTPFNGGKGYKAGYRLNSSGTESEETETFVTGFIPVNKGDQLYFQDIDWYNEPGNNNKCYVYTYDESFSNSGTYFRDQMLTNLGNYNWAIENGSLVLDENNHLTSIRIGNGLAGGDNNVKYVRISAWSISDTSVITINQPIE